MEAHPPRQPEIEAETATGKKRRTRLKSEGSVPGNAAYWREHLSPERRPFVKASS
jgi:hypothetical protein